MKSRLKVIKVDGRCEEYLHTKVMHTIVRALGCTEQSDIVLAENLSEVVTYFLYNKHGEAAVSSSEILSIIKVALSAAGYDGAAEALADHHYYRKLRRGRTELVRVDLEKQFDARELFGGDGELEKAPWDKSVIVEDLITKRGLDHHCARMVAGMVEEKVFALELGAVPASLVKQLVLTDTAAVMRAQRQLRTA
jgi:hypothetical protein